MQYKYNNVFWGLKHPLIKELADGKITPAQFVARVTVWVPVTVTLQGNVTYITGHDRSAIESAKQEHDVFGVLKFRTTLGFDKEKIVSLKDKIMVGYPNTTDLFASMSSDEGCPDCTKELLCNSIIQEMLQSGSGDPSCMESDLPPITYRILCGESVDDSSIRDALANSPVMKMQACDSRKRSNFFRSKSCKQGASTTNCEKCRLNAGHRENMFRKHVVPESFTLPVNAGEVKVLVSRDPFDVDFMCPFADKVKELQGDLYMSMPDKFKVPTQVIAASQGDNNTCLSNHKEQLWRKTVCFRCSEHDSSNGKCAKTTQYLALQNAHEKSICPLYSWDI